MLCLGSVAITLEQGQHKEKESGLQQEKRVLKVEIKEMELAHQETVKTLKKVCLTYCSEELLSWWYWQEHDQALTKVREEFEQRAVDLENKYERKMSALREELELRRKTEIHEVEEVHDLHCIHTHSTHHCTQFSHMPHIIVY